MYRPRLVGPRLRCSERLRALAASRPAEGPLDLDDPGAVFDTFIQSGLDTLIRLREEIDRDALVAFVEALAAARTVHIVAARGAFGVGAYCFYGLSQVGKRAGLVDNLGSMRAERMRCWRSPSTTAHPRRPPPPRPRPGPAATCFRSPITR